MILNSMIASNTSPEGKGGGLLAVSQSVVQNNRIIGNSAKLGGGAWLSNNVTMTNCCLGGNIAEEGGAFYLWGPATVINCTALDNTASVKGGGMLCQDAVTTAVRNSIFWNNHAPQGEEIMLADSTKVGAASISHSCIQGGQMGVVVHANWSLTWGAGNIEQDPAFADPDGPDNVLSTADDDFHVTAGSPCLDSGDNAFLPVDAADLDGDGDKTELISLDAAGNVRLADDPSRIDVGSGGPPVVDMGACEGIGLYLVVSPASTVSVSEGLLRTLDVSLPLNPGASITVEAAPESGDADIEIVAGSTLTFDASHYGIPQQVVLQAKQDADFLNGSAVILLESPGLPSVRIQAIEVDDEPVPPVIHVDAAATGARCGISWADAYTELQEAISATNSRPGSSEIRVAGGTYRPDYDSAIGLHTGDRQMRFQPPSGMILRGGYAGVSGPNPDDHDPALYESILSGDLNLDDGPQYANRFENSARVVVLDSVATSTRIEGFTVRGGYGWNGAGVGISVLKCSPTIQSCRITDNWSSGGAIYIDGSPLVTDCVLDANRAYYRYFTFEGDRWLGRGAAAMVAAGNSRFDRCTFADNTSDTHGGAFYNSTGTPTLVSCTFSNNLCNTYPSYYGYEGGGAIYTNGGTLSLVDCAVTANRCRLNGGGIYCNAGSLKLTSSLIAGNLAGASSSDSTGGGAYARTTPVEIRNCTFADNRCSGSTATALYSYGVPSLFNSIFWGSAVTPPASSSSLIQVTLGGGRPTISYCCVEKWNGTWGGTGNTGSNPVFARVGSWDLKGTSDRMDDVWMPGNYRLSVASPCIDAGANAAVPADTADLDADGNTTEPIPLDLAGRPRVIDDPSTPNTGAGTPPIVDVGAYEALIVPCDFDRDWDVDPEDVDAFAACETGPAVPYALSGIPVGCLLAPAANGLMAADTDRDGDVDQEDFGTWQQCFSGTNRFADPDCAY